MNEKIGIPTGHIGSGSALLLKDTTPITAGEGSRDFGPIDTYNIMNMGLDIKADQACAVQFIRLPDGETEGEASVAAAVSANTASNFTYSEVMCPKMLVRITNTSGVDMTSFALHIRGGA